MYRYRYICQFIQEFRGGAEFYSLGKGVNNSTGKQLQEQIKKIPFIPLDHGI